MSDSNVEAVRGSGSVTQPEPRLTVVVLALDAEATLDPCLASVAGWHDVVVALDDRSQDSSRRMAESYGCTVVVLPWAGSFSVQRNNAMQAAETDWVFFLDADEEATADLKAEIDTVLTQPSAFAGYSMPRRNELLGHRMRAGGWWPDRQVRLVNRLSCSYVGEVHERVDLEAKSIGKLKSSLLHRSHPSVAAVLTRADDYSRLEAAFAIAEGKPRPGWLGIYLLPFQHFVWRFVFLGGFIDGKVGLQEARLQAFYRHLVLIRRRQGANAYPAKMFERLTPKPTPPLTVKPQPDDHPVALFPRDPLAIGLMALLILLPFHLAIKPVLPSVLGEAWKEIAVGLLFLTAVFRIRTQLWRILLTSWLMRLALAYAGLLIMLAILPGHPAAALDGLHIDLTYMPLVLVVAAVPAEQRLMTLVLPMVTAGVFCACGALIEVLIARALFPSTTLVAQYGRPEVYINGTHILRPYFTFDFPTGLGMYLAVAMLCAVLMYLAGSSVLWLLPALICAAGMTATFSRGPWVGALAGIIVVTSFVSRQSLVLRVATVGGLVGLLSLSAVLTSDGSPVAAKSTLHSSTQLRTVDGKISDETTLEGFIHQAPLVGRSGLPAPAGPFKPTKWRLMGKPVSVLSEPPPAHGRAVLAYRLVVPRRSMLAFGVMLSPKVWSSDKGDGVVFRLVIQDGGQPQSVFARYLDPKNVRSDRRLVNYRLPLFGYAGEDLTFTFSTDSGPIHDADYDWAAWINPRLVRPSTLPALGHRPYRPVAPSIEAPVPNSRFYLASIADWGGDSSNSDRVTSWRRTLTTWRQNPLLGTGPGSVDEAAIRQGQHHALVTESQIGKVLVETGSLGLGVWLALLGLAIFLLRRRFLATHSVLHMVALSGIVCITVGSLVFQVLEVKQVAAIFWAFIGLAVVAELEAPLLMPARLAFAASGIASPFGGTATPARPVVTDVVPRPEVPPAVVPTPEISPAVPSGTPRGLAISLPAEDSPAALSRISRVKVASGEGEVNEALDSGWRLLATGITRDGPVFILGTEGDKPSQR